MADLAEALAERIPVRVVAPRGRNAMVRRQGGITVYGYTSPERPLSLLSPARPTDWPAIVGTLGSLRAQTLAAAEDGRVAHSLALWVLPSGWAAATLQRRQGIPYSVWALGSDIWSLGRVPGIGAVLRQVVKRSTRCFADGLQLARDAQHLSGKPFEFLPSTRRLSDLRARAFSSSRPYRLLFLGRWHLNKGIDLLLEALALLGDDDWSRITEVHIAGGGPMATLVRDRADSLLAAGRPVRVSGFLDRQQATRALSDADYLLLPSRIESIPVVFSDAMKCGLPVISTPVGDLPSLLQRFSCGALAAEISAHAYATVLASSLASGPERWSEGTHRAAEAFNLEAIADRLTGLVGRATYGQRA